LGAVAPTGLVLGFGHGVHLSRLVDTIVATYAADLKGGMAGRLRNGERPRLAPLMSPGAAARPLLLDFAAQDLAPRRSADTCALHRWHALVVTA
ncbi:hypothetical protein B0E41_10470, partial [Hydrogenophaga sp. A37]